MICPERPTTASKTRKARPKAAPLHAAVGRQERMPAPAMPFRRRPPCELQGPIQGPRLRQRRQSPGLRRMAKAMQGPSQLLEPPRQWPSQRRRRRALRQRRAPRTALPVRTAILRTSSTTTTFAGSSSSACERGTARPRARARRAAKRRRHRRGIARYTSCKSARAPRQRRACASHAGAVPLTRSRVQTYPVCDCLEKRYFMAASSKPRGS